TRSRDARVYCLHGCYLVFREHRSACAPALAVTCEDLATFDVHVGFVVQRLQLTVDQHTYRFVLWNFWVSNIPQFRNGIIARMYLIGITIDGDRYVVGISAPTVFVFSVHMVDRFITTS